MRKKFDTFFFGCRYIIIVIVIATLLASVTMLIAGFRTTMDGIYLIKNIFSYSFKSNYIVSKFITAVDEFLFATVLFIFSIGLYELFIKGEEKETKPHWLHIKSLEDLKEALGRVVLVILIITFFKNAISMSYGTPTSLVYLGIAILLIAFSLFITHILPKRKD